MKFKQAVEGTPDVKACYYPGLGAIRRRDRQRIKCRRPSLIAGSIYLDQALEHIYPNSPRWDYGVGIVFNPQMDIVVWIEVHPASTGNVKEILAKTRGLKTWLGGSANLIGQLKGHQFHWIATGSVRISRNSPQARALAQMGIVFPAKYLDLERC